MYSLFLKMYKYILTQVHNITDDKFTVFNMWYVLWLESIYKLVRFKSVTIFSLG